MNIEKKVADESKSLYRKVASGVNGDGFAKQSYLLATSLEDMYGSDQYFQEETQIESLPKAIEAAKEARDNLLELTESRTVFDGSPLSTQEAKQELTRNAVASTLLVFWCAHGLTGIDRASAARKVFDSFNGGSQVQNWNGFKQILARECQRYIS